MILNNCLNLNWIYSLLRVCTIETLLFGIFQNALKLTVNKDGIWRFALFFFKWKMLWGQFSINWLHWFSESNVDESEQSPVEVNSSDDSSVQIVIEGGEEHHIVRIDAQPTAEHQNATENQAQNENQNPIENVSQDEDVTPSKKKRKRFDQFWMAKISISFDKMSIEIVSNLNHTQIAVKKAITKENGGYFKRRRRWWFDVSDLLG